MGLNRFRPFVFVRGSMVQTVRLRDTLAADVRLRRYRRRAGGLPRLPL